MRIRLAVVTATILAATSTPALAGPSDVDPSWGTGGVVVFPAGDRYDAQGAPLLQSGGKVLAAGLLRNSSDRVFIDRLTPAGAIDPSFGTAGELHTNSVAPYRNAPTALLPDGRVLVIAGSNKDGRLTLERFTADGVPDTSFGTSGSGRLNVDLGGTFVDPTGVVALSPTSTLVTALSDTGGSRAMTLLKFTSTGLDTTFGVKGIARATFAKPSGAYALAVLSNGAVQVAGAVGDTTTAAVDVGLARFTSAGLPDVTFDGDGKATYDLTGTGAADYATSIAADATGGFAVAGPAGSGQGLVARFTSTGARDTTFATGGVQLGGFAPAGSSFTPAGLTLDNAGRMVVAGTATAGSGTGATSRWLVARLLRGTGSTLDGAFAPGGAVQLSQCANVSGYGPSGVAVQSDDRIDVLGSCGDQGQVAVARLLGRPAFPTTAALSVSPGAAPAGHERVPLANVDPTTVLGAVDRYASAPLGSGPLGSGPLGSGPLGSGPLGSGPLGSGPLGSGPLGSGPLGSGPLGSGPLGSGPLGSGPLDQQILLSDLPLLNGQTWTQLLAPYYPNGVPPLQTLTLADAYRVAPAVVDALSYADIDITRTPLRTASLAAVLLTRPLASVDPPAGGWCSWLHDTQTKLTCDNGADPSRTTLLGLEFAGDDLSAYYARPVSLLRSAGTDLGTGSSRAMLAYLDLRQVDTTRTPLGAVPASQLSSLLSCGSSCTGTVADQQARDLTGWTHATIGDLAAALPLPSLPDLSLGQLLAGMVNVADIPYEHAPARQLLDAAELRGDHLQTYTTSFTVDCGQATSLQLVPQLADDARLVPHSATVAVGGGTAAPLADATRGSDGTLAYDLSRACAGRSGANTPMVVTFTAEPGSVLGPKAAAVQVRNGADAVSATVKTTVDDSLDPGDQPTDTRPLGTDRLVHGWISSARDIDYYAFAAPAAGTRVSITLTHIPQGADYDLHVYGPVDDVAAAPLHSGPLGSGPLGSGPLGSGAVPDTTASATDPSIAPPDGVQDLPLGSGPLGSGPLGSGSINRGSADEGVTFLVRRADVGRTITVQVNGYDGSSDAHPYVLRRTDLVPPPAPACPSRSITGGTAGQWPSSVPSDTQALYLVDRARLAALNSEQQAGDVMSGLNALAAQTHGVVVPVESDPATDVSSAYAAWDQSPCDESKANAVVAKVNQVVDDVKRAGGGLRSLRSIVLVGPDPVLPQARLRDDAVLSNETDYANDAEIGGHDDAVSGALRDGYLLSDDPYGDFDVSKTMYVPDVALGRLVETAPEISAQIQRFLSTNGEVDPSDAVVMGYDFFSDGAQQEASSLGTTARLDNWDATAALNAINRPGAGYTLVNGHYDASRALPSAAFSGDGSPDLLYARDAKPNPGSVLFTMGCHSGLNISAQVSSPSAQDQLRLGDWAQRMAQQQALWAGSTGFSYGDTEAVAYTERIMASTAANMATHHVTVGQALMYAKQAYVANAGVLDVYGVKASEEATFYGLPMYRIGSDGTAGASAMPPAAPSGTGTLTSDPLTVQFDDGHVPLTPHDTPRGTYYTAGGQDPVVVQDHPVEPVYTKALPTGDAQAHGYLIESLQTEELPPADPVIARPTVDLAAHEPEPAVSSPLFPAQLDTVTNQATPDGRVDKLTLAAGQYRQDHQRLFRLVGGRVMRSTGADFAPVTIRRVDGQVSGGAFTVRVEVDGSDAQGGNVLYRTDADTGSTVTWHRADLAVVGDGVLATGGTLPSGTRIDEAIVQVYDGGGNVALSDYKVQGYAFAPLAQPKAGDPHVTFSPAVPPSGYEQTSPQVSLDPGDHSAATFQYSLDGGPWQSYTPGSTFQVPEPADGEHLIAFRGSDGSYAVSQVAIDRTGPTVTAEPDRSPDGSGSWYDAPVTVTFRCADAVSGVASCPPAQTVSAEGKDQVVSGTATDRAGNSGSGSLTVSIDKTPPTIKGAFSPATPDHGSWYWTAPTLSWTCADALSGVASCPPSTTAPEGTAETLKGTARDNAGNTADGTAGPVNVDLQNGTAAITTPNGAVLTAPGLPCLSGGTDCHSVNGTAADTPTGSGIARVDVTYTPGLGVPVTKQATLTCDAQHRCTWSAGLPSTGVGYKVTVKVTEVSGRTFAAGPSSITVTVS